MPCSLAFFSDTHAYSGWTVQRARGIHQQLATVTAQTSIGGMNERVRTGFCLPIVFGLLLLCFII